MYASITSLNNREMAALHAVARGTAELTCSEEPDLFIEGFAFCDQYTARQLVHRGLIIAAVPAVPAVPAGPGERVRAALTDAGAAAIRTRKAAA